MNRTIPSFLTADKPDLLESPERKGTLRMSFIDHTVKTSAGVVKASILQYEIARIAKGFQKFSSQGILILFVIYIVCISISVSLTGQLLFTGLIFMLLITTTVPLKAVYFKAIVLAFFFGFMVMLPACLNVFSPGKILIPIIRFESERQFWIYHVPAEIGVTREGSIIVCRMFMKVFNSLSLTFLVIYSISFDRLVKSLRLLKVPSLFILIITMTYKFIYSMALTIEEMYLAMRSRWIGNYNGDKTRHIIAGRIGFLFKKSFQRYEDVYRAMISRGYTGEIHIALHEKIRGKEAFILFLLVGIGIAICLIENKWNLL